MAFSQSSDCQASKQASKQADRHDGDEGGRGGGGMVRDHRNQIREPAAATVAAQPNAASFSIVCILNLGPNYTRGREGSKKRKEGRLPLSHSTITLFLLNGRTVTVGADVDITCASPGRGCHGETHFAAEYGSLEFAREDGRNDRLVGRAKTNPLNKPPFQKGTYCSIFRHSAENITGHAARGKIAPDTSPL